ncbi:MAG: flavin reductase family protein [Alphaproteobacteria bacterium]|nr:flavin reductase family protein [Alphaproteobacteria bacterium]
MRKYVKSDFPIEKVRRFLEPGPVVLVSSAWQGASNIMTLGWHTVMEFSPSLVGCVISSANHSFDLIRRSKQCVINVPEVHLIDQVVGIGNSSGAEMDKFAEFKLTRAAGAMVKAPLIAECFANLECKLVDARLIQKYNYFIFEVVKAHAARAPKYPRTVHYRGEGMFMISGPPLNMRRKFKPEMLV